MHHLHVLFTQTKPNKRRPSRVGVCTKFLPTGEIFLTAHWRHLLVFSLTVQTNFETLLDAMQHFIEQSWLIATLRWRILLVDNQILKYLKQIRISSWWSRAFQSVKLLCKQFGTSWMHRIVWTPHHIFDNINPVLNNTALQKCLVVGNCQIFSLYLMSADLQKIKNNNNNNLSLC